MLFVHSSDEGYGADRVLLAMVHGCLRQGRDVSVLLPDDSPSGWLSDQLSEAGIATVKGPLAPARRKYLTPRYLARYALELLRARRFVRGAACAHRAGIVHVNTSAMLVAVIVGRPGGARLVWHVHEIISLPQTISWLFRLAPLTADMVIVVSDAVRLNLLGGRLLERKVFRIYNGVTPPDPSPTATPWKTGPGPLVAYVGRLSSWKGYSLFIEAVGAVAPDFPEAEFLVVGDPPPGQEWHRDELRRQVEKQGLGDRVIVRRFCSDPAAIFDAVDIVAVPSTLPDPLPTVILEAMRSKCAVIASNHGGAPEMILDEECGLLIPPGRPEALAAAIRRLLEDPSLRRRLGEAAQERILGSFMLSRFHDDLEGIYETLDQRSATRRRT